MDAITLLADDGLIWLLTPKTGQDGYVEPSDVAEACGTAGLTHASSVSGGVDWMITRLARQRSQKIPRRP